MIVSEPVKVAVEIKDMSTGCTYVYKGNNLNDCISYFKSLFICEREYNILRCEDVL